MPDSIIPQWPYIPAIQGQVPTPRPDPRQDKSLAFAKALMGAKVPVPMPTPDPRSWTDRAISSQMHDEKDSMGAIHPDDYLKLHGVPAGSGTDNNTYATPAINSIIRNNAAGPQRPFGEPDPGFQRSAGLFGVSPQHLQQIAGDVIPFPKSLHDQDVNRFQGGKGPDVPLAAPFDPKGDMTGGGKVVPIPLPGMMAANTPQPPLKPPYTPGSLPLDPNILNWGQKGNLAPTDPPMYWKPG